MSATDVDGAKNRLDEAKKLVGGLIDQMESGMTAMIISFADTPQVVQEFTDNRRLLRERLATIQPSVRGTDLRGALELADGLANPGRVTDRGRRHGDRRRRGAAGDAVHLQRRPVRGREGLFAGQSCSRCTCRSVRSRPRTWRSPRSRRGGASAKPEERQAFVQVANFTERAAEGRGRDSARRPAFSTPRKSRCRRANRAASCFRWPSAPAGKLTAQLKYELAMAVTHDALAQDDIGYAALNDAKPGNVLVITPGNVALEMALTTERAGRLGEIQIQAPSYLETDEYKKAVDSGAYDLVIYDQCAPKSMPRANTLFIGRLPPGPVWRGGEDASGCETAADGKRRYGSGEQRVEPRAEARCRGPQIIDWDRAHPLLASVELGNVDIVDSLVLDPPPGATVLIDSTAGPIAAIAPRDAYQDVVLGFEIVGQDKDGARTVEHQLAAAAELSDVLAERAGVSGRRDRGIADRASAAGPAGRAARRRATRRS